MKFYLDLKNPVTLITMLVRVRHFFFVKCKFSDFFFCANNRFQDERWATRGCTIDISDAIDSTENIEICSGFGCNSENILHSQCVSCESDVDGECAKVENKDSFMKKCEGTYPHEKRGCYTLVKSK